MCDISIREHIRWLPDEASEPTSTMVLTSPGRRFVDVRILLPLPGDGDSSDEDHLPLPLDRLDWAIAGTSSSSSRVADDSSEQQPIKHSVWRHWIDSRTPDAEQVVDEGDMHPRPGGRTLETGRMVNPLTGIETDYEELWRSEEALPVPVPVPVPVPTTVPGGIISTAATTASCVVLQMQADGAGARGMVVRLGQYCQGVLRVGDEFTAERWAWQERQKQGKKGQEKAEGEEGQGGEEGRRREPKLGGLGGEGATGGWTRIAKLGNGSLSLSLPCNLAMNRAEELKTGEEVVDGQFVWQIVEVVRL